MAAWAHTRGKTRSGAQRLSEARVWSQQAHQESGMETSTGALQRRRRRPAALGPKAPRPRAQAPPRTVTPVPPAAPTRWMSPRAVTRTGECAGFVVSFCKRLLSITCVPRQRHTRPIPRLPSEGEGAATKCPSGRNSDVGTGQHQWGGPPLAVASELSLGGEE